LKGRPHEKTLIFQSFGDIMRCIIPSRDQVRPETPLRLGVAAALAFPDVTVTVSGLSREAARVQLIGEYVLGHPTLSAWGAL
jgi:hypothetical protein